VIKPSRRSPTWATVFIATLLDYLSFINVIIVRAQSFGAYADLHDFGATITNANGTTGPDGSSPSAGVTFDSAGNMYGTAGVGGANNAGMVWEITAAGVYKDLHDFGGTITNAGGTSGSDGNEPYAGVTFAGGNIVWYDIRRRCE
jgi:uncharacterized repeat protein (TIGR03803 family)